MKRIITLTLIMCCLLLTGCDNASIGVIGGADGPTKIIVSEKENSTIKSSDVKKYFKEHYVDERELPVLDINIENPFVSDDRTLIRPLSKHREQRHESMESHHHPFSARNILHEHVPIFPDRNSKRQ